MCGITGIINLGRSETPEVKNIQAMTQALRHRGPDDEGYLLVNKRGCQIFKGNDTQVDGSQAARPNYIPKNHIAEAEDCPSCLAFGHRRLSILDLSMSGHQPMSYLGRYWIVHNGEIYNYLELRQELAAAGYAFHSQSDTEVIMASYDKWGSACLSRFNGMWAFAIYDSRDHKLFLSRDRFGIKPLSYYIDEHRFIFASEIKSILKHAHVQARPNLHHIRRFLKAHCAEYRQETAFENVYHFPSASYVELDISRLRKNTFVPKKFWSCKINLSDEPFDEAKAEALAGEYLELLADAVRLRLRADVKVGSAFSGGLDSSSVVYLINQHLKAQNAEEKQQTFSTVFKSKEVRHCDESQYIDALSKALGIVSNQIQPTADRVFQAYERMVYAMDTPQEDSHMAGMFTYQLVAASDVVVSLDGQGADELQAGYLPYLVNYFCHLPLSELRKEARRFAQIPGSAPQIRLGIVFNVPRRLSLNRFFVRLLRLMGKYSDPFIHPNQRLYNDLVGNLVNLFYFGDRTSMAHSIETRFPFMDYRLVEFWFRLPIVYKMHNGWTKYIARKAFNGKLPDTITWRKDKMGWEMPQAHWFRGELKEWVIHRIQSSHFLPQLGVRMDVRKKLESDAMTRKTLKQIVKLLNLAIWYDTFIDAHGKPADVEAQACFVPCSDQSV